MHVALILRFPALDFDLHVTCTLWNPLSDAFLFHVARTMWNPFPAVSFFDTCD